MKIAPDEYVIDLSSASFPKVNQSSLAQLVKNKDLGHLATLGGVEGLVSALKTDVEHGIHADSDDITRRQEAFGLNTYPRLPSKSFFSVEI